MRTLFKDITNLFYPPLCIGCRNALLEKEKILCLACEYSLPVTDFHTYKDNPIEKVFYSRFILKNGSSYLYFRKDGIVQNIMHHFKYSGIREAGILLGRKYGSILAKNEEYRDIDYIIPVPLHKKKQKARGYNQSEEFGKGLAESMHTELMVNNLVRSLASETQAKKTRAERWKNVDGIFEVLDKEVLKNKKVLLVDDVVTTGATLESCAQILITNCPGIEINVATIAFAT